MSCDLLQLHSLELSCFSRNLWPLYLPSFALILHISNQLSTLWMLILRCEDTIGICARTLDAISQNKSLLQRCSFLSKAALLRHLKIAWLICQFILTASLLFTRWSGIFTASIIKLILFWRDRCFYVWSILRRGDLRGFRVGFFEGNDPISERA